jgi:ABC-type Zn uptake system ZnuABC Zn-binding protein ZnuA
MRVSPAGGNGSTRLTGPRGGRRLALLLTIVLTACSAAVAADRDPAVVHAVVSLNVLADFVREVGGERVAAEALVPIGGDPHVHEPAPSDAVAVADSDLVVRNGLGLEPWLDRLTQPVDDVVVVTVSDDLTRVAERDSRGDVDPHLWMVPGYAMAYVRRIEAALAQTDPEGAELYRANADAYVAQLHALDAELADAIATIPSDRRLLVTSHDAYSYFAAHFGLEVVGSVLGVTTEEEPSARSIRELIDQIRFLEVPTLFMETTVNPSVIEQVARDSGATLGRPLYGDSLGDPGSGAETYIGMMRANVDAIVDGLTGSP